MIGPIHGRDLRISPPQMLILISVRNEKKYGYEILKDIRDTFEGVWEPKTGAIYPAIKKLQENGLLESEMVDGKEHYSLTAEGLRFLTETLPKMGAMVSMMTRYTVIIEDAITELGLEVSKFEDMDSKGKEEKLRHFLEMRSHLEMDLIKINEAIEKIAGGIEWKM